jgi:hypothetical protein
VGEAVGERYSVVEVNCGNPSEEPVIQLVRKQDSRNKINAFCINETIISTFLREITIVQGSRNTAAAYKTVIGLFKDNRTVEARIEI